MLALRAFVVHYTLVAPAFFAVKLGELTTFVPCINNTSDTKYQLKRIYLMSLVPCPPPRNPCKWQRTVMRMGLHGAHLHHAINQSRRRALIAGSGSITLLSTVSPIPFYCPSQLSDLSPKDVLVTRMACFFLMELHHHRDRRQMTMTGHRSKTGSSIKLPSSSFDRMRWLKRESTLFLSYGRRASRNTMTMHLTNAIPTCTKLISRIYYKPFCRTS